GDLFPTLAAVSDVVLLLAGELRRQLGVEEGGRTAEVDGSVRLTLSELEGLLLKLKQRHQEFWSKDLRAASSSQLAEMCIELMESWGLGKREDRNHFLVSPVLSRWNAEYANAEFDQE